MKDQQLNYIIIGLLVLVIIISLTSSCKHVEGYGSGYPHSQYLDEINLDNENVANIATNPQVSNQNNGNKALNNGVLPVDIVSNTANDMVIDNTVEGFGSDHFHRSVLSDGEGHANSLHQQNGYPNNDCSQMGNTCAYGVNYNEEASQHNDNNIQGYNIV
jgi:hypothetical protein